MELTCKKKKESDHLCFIKSNFFCIFILDKEDSCACNTLYIYSCVNVYFSVTEFFIFVHETTLS